MSKACQKTFYIMCHTSMFILYECRNDHVDNSNNAHVHNPKFCLKKEH